jgi:hypothetical protein
LVYQTGGWRALRRSLHNTIEEGLPLDPDRPPWARPAIWLGIFLLVFSFAWDIAEHFR